MTETGLSDKGKELFNRSQKTTAGMKGLISGLLSYSLVGSSKKLVEDTDLNKSLEEVKSELSERIEEIGTTIESGIPPRVKVVPLQIHQLLSTSSVIQYDSAKKM